MLAEIQGGNPLPAFIVVIVILGLLIFAFMTAVRVWRQTGSPSSDMPSLQPPSVPTDPAFAELRERLARGEIGEDECLRKARLLGYPTPAVLEDQPRHGSN
jgi:uncharacterized membrane protein